MDIHFDCQYYNGEVPCEFERLCSGCSHYTPWREKILILKLGALGDVLRTFSILPALLEKFPKGQICWVAREEAVPLLEMAEGIDRIFPFCWESVLELTSETFDYLYSFDKDREALSLAEKIQATHKFGFRKTHYGGVGVFNPQSEYALRLGIDNFLKFRINRKTYCQILYEMAELPLPPKPYRITVPKEACQEVVSSLPSIPLIGLNVGVGEKYPTKFWGEKQLLLCTELLRRQFPEKGVLLLGGAKEASLCQRIKKHFAKDSKVLWLGVYPIPLFAALIQQCQVVISSDSFAMHLAIALSVPVVALFGPTSAVEIDLFGVGEKIASSRECSPCYRSHCPYTPTCMEELHPSLVVNAIQNLLCTEKK